MRLALDEFTKEAPTIRVDRKLNSVDVVDALGDLFTPRRPPAYLRSENGPEFVAEKLRTWIAAVGAKTAFIEPGSPMGKRLPREPRRQAPRRAAEPRDLLLPPRRADPHRTTASPRQRRPAAQRPRLPTASYGGHRPRRSETRHALTIQLGPLGGGSPDGRRFRGRGTRTIAPASAPRPSWTRRHPAPERYPRSTWRPIGVGCSASSTFTQARHRLASRIRSCPGRAASTGPASGRARPGRTRSRSVYSIGRGASVSTKG